MLPPSVSGTHPTNTKKNSSKFTQNFEIPQKKNPAYFQNFRNKISKPHNFENSPQTLLHNNNIRRNHSSP
jgi:hypothetical protein